jgi:hypothetical protein
MCVTWVGSVPMNDLYLITYSDKFHLNKCFCVVYVHHVGRICAYEWPVFDHVSRYVCMHAYVCITWTEPVSCYEWAVFDHEFRYIHTYMHTYIHTHMHTYKHTYG